MGDGTKSPSPKRARSGSARPLLCLPHGLCPLSEAAEPPGSASDLLPHVSGTNFAISSSARLSFDVSPRE